MASVTDLHTAGRQLHASEANAVHHQPHQRHQLHQTTGAAPPRPHLTESSWGNRATSYVRFRAATVERIVPRELLPITEAASLKCL